MRGIIIPHLPPLSEALVWWCVVGLPCGSNGRKEGTASSFEVLSLSLSLSQSKVSSSSEEVDVGSRKSSRASMGVFTFSNGDAIPPPCELHLLSRCRT